MWLVLIMIGIFPVGGQCRDNLSDYSLGNWYGFGVWIWFRARAEGSGAQWTMDETKINVYAYHLFWSRNNHHVSERLQMEATQGWPARYKIHQRHNNYSFHGTCPVTCHTYALDNGISYSESDIRNYYNFWLFWNPRLFARREIILFRVRRDSCGISVIICV